MPFALNVCYISISVYRLHWMYVTFLFLCPSNLWINSWYRPKKMNKTLTEYEHGYRKRTRHTPPEVSTSYQLHSLIIYLVMHYEISSNIYIVAIFIPKKLMLFKFDECKISHLLCGVGGTYDTLLLFWVLTLPVF